MKVLVACEESQEVCKAFREKGHEAYSCDIQEPSGGHPEWHILGDAIKAIKGGQVVTMDGVTHDVGKWDLLIAHPPCTHLAVSGARWFTEGRKPLSLRFEAAAFFMKFAETDIQRIAIENPVCVMVALLAEGVDRNSLPQLTAYSALHPGIANLSPIGLIVRGTKQK